MIPIYRWLSYGLTVAAVLLTVLGLVAATDAQQESAGQPDNSPGMAQSPEEKTIDEFEDLRAVMLQRKGKDLTTMDLRNVDLFKNTFDSFTAWPPREMLPKDFNPKRVLQWGKCPGLGVRELHERGVTGKGVHVAIIDQPLLQGHQEYKSQLVQYTAIDCEEVPPQMHGPAVASLLVGRECGVAPDAKLHFWAEPSWKRDFKYRCEAVEQIMAHNEGKPKGEQIRVVSVSKGFSREPNLARWQKVLQLAESKGIYVIHCSANMLGVGCPVFEDRDDSNKYRLWYHAGNRPVDEPRLLYAPVDNRTTAHWEADDAYIFWSKGGLSWGAPFIAGVAALGLQMNPELTPGTIRKHLYATGTTFNKGKIINPRRFVETVMNL